MSELIPYCKHTVTPEDEAAVLRALRSGYLTQGPEIEAFEHELAALSGAKYAIAVNSGTAALHLAYAATGVTVIAVPAISFVATANAAHHANRRVEFIDCDREDGLIVLGAEPQEIEVVVTLGGEPLSGWGARTIVDACHGPIRHPDCALATCFSFHPAKHVACGEGGAIVTNDAAFADQCRLLRSHGRRGTEMVALGYNYRMPEMGAALGRSQLARYTENVRERRRLAHWYDQAFAGKVQTVPHGPESARHLYQLLLPNRDAAQQHLASRGIGTAIHYPVIPLQPYYRDRYGYRPGMFPGAESHAARTLSLPLFPGLTEAEQDRVIAAVLEVAG